jgi:hypothetical protein
MRHHAEGKHFPENRDRHIVSPLYTPDAEYRARLIAFAEDPANVGRVPTWLINDLARLRRAPNP